MRGHMWDFWCKAIGTKAYDDDDRADVVALIRTTWVLLHVTTCSMIIVGNGRLLGIW